MAIRIVGGSRPRGCPPERFLLAMAIPGRTLFVAKSWSKGADPNIFFTSWQAAINRAAAFSVPASAASPVDIIGAPGVYDENLVLPPTGFINLKTLGAGGGVSYQSSDVTINGSISWSPSATGSPYTLIAGLKANSFSISGANFNAWLALANVFSPLLTVNGGANAQTSASVFTAANITNGSFLSAPAGTYIATLTVDTPSAANLLGGDYFQLASGGTVNRTYWMFTTGALGAGANVITLDPNYPDTNYKVFITPRNSQAATTAAYADTYAVSSFTLRNVTAGAVYDVLVMSLG